MNGKEERIWVNREGAALSFLPKESRAAKDRKRRHREKTRHEAQEENQAAELHTLEHGIEVAKRESVKASWERRTRDYAHDLTPPPPPPPTLLEKAWRKKLEKNELELQNDEAAARLGQEKAIRAKTQAIEVYRNLHMTKGEKRLRIEEILKAYDVDETILPPAIREVLEEED